MGVCPLLSRRLSRLYVLLSLLNLSACLGPVPLDTMLGTSLLVTVTLVPNLRIHGKSFNKLLNARQITGFPWLSRCGRLLPSLSACTSVHLPAHMSAIQYVHAEPCISIHTVQSCTHEHVPAHLSRAGEFPCVSLDVKRTQSVQSAHTE